MSQGYRCDGPECSRWAGDRSHMHNWYSVVRGLDSSVHTTFEFCSKECLVRWMHA